MTSQMSYTLCLITNNDQVLLQKREREPFAGKWNAPGGKIEANETVDFACIREVYEETGLRINFPNLIARITFSHISSKDTIYVFHSEYFSENYVKTNNELKWFKTNQLNLIQESIAFGLDWFLEIASSEQPFPVEIEF